MPGTPQQHPLDGAPYFSDGVDHLGHAECVISKPAPGAAPAPCIPLPAGTPAIAQRLLERAYHLGYKSVEEMAASHPGGGGAPRPVDQVHPRAEVDDAIRSGAVQGGIVVGDPDVVARAYGYDDAAEMRRCELAGRDVDAELDAAARGQGLAGGLAEASALALSQLDAAERVRAGVASPGEVTLPVFVGLGQLQSAFAAVRQAEPVVGKVSVPGAASPATDPVVEPLQASIFQELVDAGARDAGRVDFGTPDTGEVESPVAVFDGVDQLAVEDGPRTVTEHAEYELRRSGAFDDDPRWAQAVLSSVAAFMTYGHSGSSAYAGADMVRALVLSETLSPLTSDPAEWFQAADDVWQNRRDSRAMSSDGGRSWYFVDARHAGERCYDRGVLGTLVACPECAGVGVRHQADGDVGRPVVPAGEPVEVSALVELAWGVIANVSEGDWGRQTPEWHAAAVRWREGWHRLLALRAGGGSRRGVLGQRLYELYGASEPEAEPPVLGRAVFGELDDAGRESWLMAADELMLLLGVSEDVAWGENELTASLRGRLGVVDRMWSEQATLVETLQARIEQTAEQGLRERSALAGQLQATAAELEERTLQRDARQRALTEVSSQVGLVVGELDEILAGGGDEQLVRQLGGLRDRLAGFAPAGPVQPGPRRPVEDVQGAGGKA